MFIVSSFAIANGLMSWNYDLYADGETHVCHGTHCFRIGFFICAGLCAAAVVLSLVLSQRRREFYACIHK
jgi:hypothetical protein